MSRALDPRLVAAVPQLRARLAIQSALHGLLAITAIAQAVLLAKLVTSVVHGNWAHPLPPELFVLLAVGLGRSALLGYQEWLATSTARLAQRRLRSLLLAKIGERGPSWVAGQPGGRLVTATGAALEPIEAYLSRATPARLAAVVSPPILLAAIFVADWQSGLLLLAVLPLVPLFMVLIGKTTARRMAEQYAMLSRLSGHFLDLVSGLTTLKIYGRARRQITAVHRASEAYRRQSMATLRVALLSGSVLDVLATLSIALVAVDVGLRLDHASLALLPALTVLLLVPGVFAPIRAVGLQHHAGEQGRAALDDIMQLLQDDPAAEQPAPDAPAPALAPEAEAVDPAPPATAGPDRLSVSIRGLGLRYPSRDDDALSDLDLDIPAGQVLALRGRSGGGKSSLIASLLELAPAHRGQILVDSGAGPQQLRPEIARQWRQATGWLPQRPQPTQPTVGAEVALGDEHASATRIEGVLARCCAPAAGTPLGEQGAAISAGQRRRVALARVLLRACAVRDRGEIPLVLLDEPSEDLDARTAAVVVSVIDELAGWATVVMATHSDQLAAAADRVVVIEAGRLISDRAQRPERGAEVPPPTAVAVARAEPTGTGAAKPAALLWRCMPWRRLIGAALLDGLTGMASLALTATSIWLLCRAADHPNVQALSIAVVGVRTFALARALLGYLNRLAAHDTALRMLSDVRSRVFAALEPIAGSGTAMFSRGDLLRRFVTDVDGAQEAVVRTLVPLAGAALTVAAAVTVSTLLVPAAGLALALLLLLALVVVPAATRLGSGADQGAAADRGYRAARVTGFVEGLAELAAFGADRRTLADIDTVEARLARQDRRDARAGALGVLGSGMLAAAGLTWVIALGGAAAGAGTMGRLGIGVLLACALAGFDAVAGLPAAFSAWNRCRAGLDRVAEVLASPPAVAEPAVPSPVAAGALGLSGQRIELRTPDGTELLLIEGRLRVEPGSRVAIAGPSGCGKTSLLAAALRLRPVHAGRWTLDTPDAAPVALSELGAGDMPELVAGSLQGDHVFQASLRDNLRVVRPAAGEHELDAVAARVGLLDFIRSVPGGWDCPAGMDGSGLSGGQRQRLLLARALLAAPRILVLDEPTAHLDPDTEREVLADLLGGTRGQTVLLSSHRVVPDGQLDVRLRLADGQLHPVAAADRPLADARVAAPTPGRSALL